MPDSTMVSKGIESSFDFLHLLDIVKWPLLVLIVILIIRKPLIDLLNRITKVGYGNTMVEAQQQMTNEPQANKKISTVEKALGIFREDTREYFRKAVLKESDIGNLNADGIKIDRLIDYATTIYIMKSFESVYSSIYGSQISILLQLNTIAKEDFSSLKRYYTTAVGNNPKFYEGYSYEEYLGYLLSFNLITEAGAQIKITTLGIDFLKYLAETGLNFNKPN